jgi:hypothetical protein
MWKHCNNISCREDKTELDVDGINKVIDALNNDNDVLRFSIYLRSYFMFIKSYIQLITKIMWRENVCTTGIKSIAT